MNPAVLVNQGNQFRLQGNLLKAIDYYDQAIALKPDYANAYNNRGCVLQELERWEDAFIAYNVALTIKPYIPYLLGNWWYTSMQIARWQGTDNVMKEIKEGIDAGSPVVAPFIAILMPLTLEQMRKCAQIYAKN